jgi:hypothetical protein
VRIDPATNAITHASAALPISALIEADGSIWATAFTTTEYVVLRLNPAP